MSNPIYKDRTRSYDERTKDLLDRMTIEEKIAQLTSIWIQRTGGVSPDQNTEDAADLTEQIRHGIGQITRPFGSHPIDPVEGAKMVNELQRKLVEETRLGIPAICHEECLTGFMAQGATSFPSPLNFGSTWDPDLIEKVSNVIRRQMRSVGTHQGLAPVADVSRDARWGRVEETIGEDPYLVGIMVTHYVKGLQGNDIKEGVIATLKHFAGYSFSEGGRNFAPVHVGRREFNDVFLLTFEMAIKDGGALSVMNAYSDFDGEAPAASHWLLTEVLRNRWNFDGFVVSDYGAISHLHQLHHVAENKTDASAAALKAGLDVELPAPNEYPEGLKEAFEKGLITQADIDLSVSRVLKMKFRLGLFENLYVDPSIIELDLAEERALAKTVAEKSITLLTNNGLLPLPESPGKIAVLGPNADDRMALYGDYSFENHVVSTTSPDEATKIVTSPTILDIFKKRLPADQLMYARGCDVMKEETDGIAEAVDKARQADIAIVIVGDKAGLFRRGTVGEGTDTADLSLPGAQPELVESIIETGTPAVVVLINGRPFALGTIAEKASAIIEAWFPGQSGAEIIVDALFGVLNPGGKTTLTFSRGAGVMPTYYNHKFLSGGIPRLPEIEAVFPFGHGLSYTTFEYTDLMLSDTAVPVDGSIDISCTVKNTGDRSGDEVVQLYLHDIIASVTRPVKELKGFAKLSLTPGETKRVTFSLSADLLSFTGIDYIRIIEPGVIKVMIGASSKDIRLEGEFTITGSVREVDENRVLTTEVKVTECS